MKRKIIYTLFAAAILFLLCAGFNSCSNDADLNGYACMVTSLSNVKTRAGELVTEDDATVEKIRVFVFVPTGQVEKNILYVKDTPEFMNPFSICDIVQGNKEIFIVANESATLNLGAVANKSELLAKLADEISGPIDATQPLLMTGNATVNLTGDQSIEIPLTRVAAKISLNFMKADVNDDVKITKISLLSNTDKTTLFPVPHATAVATQTYWDYSKTLNNPLELQTALIPVAEIGDIYVYENLTGGDKTHATQLEVNALVNDVITTYRVYINENITAPGTGTPGEPGSSTVDGDGADHLYSIKRNHHYILNGTIVNLGEYSSLLLNTEVLPWNLLQSTFHYEKVDAVFQVAPKPPIGSPMKITSPTANINLNFKITAPAGGVWSASLTNINDFTLIKDATTNAYTWGTIGGGSGSWPDIRIALRPGVTVSPGASTEVIVRVNGVEIDFDKSGTTGPGNRLVVIYQP